MTSDGVCKLSTKMNASLIFILIIFISTCHCKLLVKQDPWNTRRSTHKNYEAYEDSDFGEEDFHLDLYSNKLEHKYNELVELAENSENSIVRITQKNCYKFLIETPRNYSVFVLFTKADESTCFFCSYTRQIYVWLAKTVHQQQQSESWTGTYFVPSQGPKNVFFAVVFDNDVPSILKKLEIQEFPTLMHFPMNGQLSNLSTFDNRHNDLARFHALNKWVEQIEGIKVVVPHGNSEYYYVDLAMKAAIVFFFGHNVYKYWGVALNSNHMAHIGLGVSVLLVSGHMFNIITRPEFIGHLRDGYAFISGGRRHQFQIEASIVSVIYFGMSLGFFFVIEGRRLNLRKPGEGMKLTKTGILLTAVTFYMWRFVTSVKLGN